MQSAYGPVCGTLVQRVPDSGIQRKGPSHDETDRQVAVTLEHQMKQLSDFLGEARIRNVHLLADRLEVLIDLDFWCPLPSGEEGDWLATPQDIRAFRLGVKKHLRSEAKTLKLSNLFYAEYLAFIRSHLSIYRFGKNVVRQLPKTAERRLAGRPRHGIRRSDSGPLRNEFRQIKSTLLEMKKLIRQWNPKRSLSKDNCIRTRVLEHYSRERFPWMRFFTSSFKKLPSMYRDSTGE